ncbi:MAG: YncE family protein [Cytophaga sp.]|nr:YncE family protein [Undibacterium sp.]
MLTTIKAITAPIYAASLGLLAMMSAISAPISAADFTYKVVATQRLEGDVKWDYLTFDGERHRLFLTRGDHVDVFDLATKSVVGTILHTNGVHGVALAPKLDRGFTSNGKDNTVTVFELSSLKVLGTVASDKKPDAIIYDAASGHVFVANGDGKNLTVFDAKSLKVISTLDVGGKPEFMTVDNKGKLFVNVEDTNQMLVIDTKLIKIKQKIELASVCDEPTGIDIDLASNTLFAGCHNQKMAIVDAKTGKIIGSPDIGKGSDATVYDAERKLAFSSNGDGTLTVIGKNAHNVFEPKQNVKTMVTARTMALDPVTHTIYLVAAEMEAADSAADKDTTQRAKLKQGSFTLITVSSN